MEKLKSTVWLGRFVALQGVLGIVGNMSLSMQTVNAIPWKLMSEKREFYGKLVSMRYALREKPKVTDSRWSSTSPDPILAKVFPFFYEDLDPKFPRHTRIQHRIEWTYMGHKLNVPGSSERLE